MNHEGQTGGRQDKEIAKAVPVEGEWIELSFLQHAQSVHGLPVAVRVTHQCDDVAHGHDVEPPAQGDGFRIIDRQMLQSLNHTDKIIEALYNVLPFPIVYD